MPRLIGFCGPKYSGKNTAANYVVRTHKYREYAFADPMKMALTHMFGLTHDQLNGNAKETIDPRWNVSPRHIMKIFGTEVCREFLKEYIPSLQKESLWISRFKQFYEMHRDEDIVVTDVRFLDEAETIRNFGGTIVRIMRETGVEPDTHQSEQILFEPDITIENNGTLEELHCKLQAELFPTRKRQTSTKDRCAKKAR